MAYVKNTWETGDVITAEKLNHMEDGIAGGSEFKIYNMVVNATYNEQTGYTGTIQTDIPGVSNWDTFESACGDLAGGYNKLYFRVNITNGSHYNFDTYQFMGLINKMKNTTVSIVICGDDCMFETGWDDGDYRQIIFGQSFSSSSLSMNDFTFVS